MQNVMFVRSTAKSIRMDDPSPLELEGKME